MQKTVYVRPTNQVLLLNILKLNKTAFTTGSKAFLIAYLYICIPKLISRISAKIKKNDAKSLISEIPRLLLKALRPERFPAFCGTLIAGFHILETTLKALPFVPHKGRFKHLPSFSAAFISALLTFPRFQGFTLKHSRFASQDLNLILLTRAADTVISSTLGHLAPTWLKSVGDVFLFCCSTTPIMFCWFLYPEKLTPSYRAWITKAAAMDDEIVDTLRMLHHGEWTYGKRGEHDDVLNPVCERYGLDKELVDPTKTCPIPCRVIHQNRFENCEIHALWRFYRGFKSALMIYLPINLLAMLRTKRPLLGVLKNTIRSSTFLALFIVLNWYPVCLVRTRLGPKLFPHLHQTAFDKTSAPLAASLACGLSSIIELPSRRRELALFTAPKSLGTIMPTEVTPLRIKLEQLSFALSFAILVIFSKRNSKDVRGLFGAGLNAVIKS